MNFHIATFTFLILNGYYNGDCATIQTSQNMNENEDGIMSLDNGFVGVSRNPNVNLPLIRRETTSSLLKKTCDNCMSSPICKTKGRCDSCKKVCEKYESSLDQQPQDLPMDEPVTVNHHGGDTTGISSRLSNFDEGQGGLSYEDDRYYTVGSFGPGSVHKLLANLLNIRDTEKIGQLVILAKTRSKKYVKSDHPVVIDTAHVFTLNEGGPSKLDMELHKVSDIQATKADAIAAELDKEIDKAMEEKRKKSEYMYLTPKEIDDIIFKNTNRDDRQDGIKMNENNIEQNKNETVTCKDEEGEDKEEVFVPMKDLPMMRENNAEIEESQSTQETSRRKPISEEDIHKNKINIGNRLRTSSDHEPIFEKKKYIISHQETDDNSQVNVGQQAPTHPKPPNVTTTEEPTTVYKSPRAPTAKDTKKQNTENEKNLNPHKEHLHETTTPAGQIMTTRHSNWPHGPQGENATKSRSNSLDLQQPSLRNRPEIALQSQQENEKYEPIYSYPSTHSKNFKSPIPREHITEDENSNPSMKLEGIVENYANKFSDDNTQFKVGAQPPIHPDSNIATTTEEPTTVYKSPRAPTAKDTKKQNKENEENLKPHKEHLQETTTPAGQIMTTRHSKWPHGPQGENATKSRSSSLDLHQPSLQNRPEIALQPQQENEKYEPIYSYPSTYSKNFKSPIPREHITEDENFNPSMKLEGIVENYANKFNDDNTQFKVGAQPPIHPDSKIATTTEEPTTVYKSPRAPTAKDSKKQNKENEENLKPHKEHLQETTTPAGQIMTTRHSKWPHGPQGENATKSKSSSLDLQQPAEEIDNGVPDPTSKLTERTMSESIQGKEIYEDKYRKLKQWVMENVGAGTPILDSRENHKNQLGEDIKGIVDSATRINEEISNMVQQNSNDPNLMQMVRENDDKLKDLDDNKKIYSIRLPNMNEFRTRLAPEQERKINEIFDNPNPMTKHRMNNDPYDAHPRRISEYENGEWTYGKAKPNKPPYPIKNRTTHPMKYEQYREDSVAVTQKPNPDYVPFVDPQLMDMDAMVKSLKEMPQIPDSKANKIVSFIEAGSKEDALNTARSDAEKKLGGTVDYREDDAGAQNDSDNAKNPTNTIQDATEILPIHKEENNETVGCSKEEDEEGLHVIHFLPLHHGYGRSSENQDLNPHTLRRNQQILENKSKSESDKSDKEHQTKSTTMNTKDMIESLNKMHRHGKTTHTENEREDFQNMDDENQRSFMQPIDDSPMAIEQYNYYPQEQRERYSMPTYTDTMRMNDGLAPNQMDSNFMEQPIMYNKVNVMDQDMIGSALMEHNLKQPLQQHSTHLGKFIPRHSKHLLHKRDVSGQNKHKTMFFVGDGIKLPLNMKEHDDGSLHLSVDVKSLCNCKHCIAKQLQNNTIVLEAFPLNEEDNLERNTTVNGTTEGIQEENIKISNNEADSKEYAISSEEIGEMISEEDKFRQHETDEIHLSKRSLRTKDSLLDNEIDSDFSKIETETPIRILTREEILNRLTKNDDSSQKPENSKTSETNTVNNQKEGENEKRMNHNTRLFGSVIDFLKNIAVDMHREYS